MKTLLSSNKLLFFIIIVHLILFLLPQFSQQSIFEKEKKPIIVRTTVITPSSKKIEQTTLIAASPPPNIKKTSLPPKPTKQAPPKKEKKNTPAKKNPSSQPKQQILTQIQKNLGKIDTNPSVNLATLKDPPKPLRLESLHSQPQTEKEIDLTSCFTFFQESLELPDKGEVKVRMNLLPNGKICQIQIISTESEANAQYVTQILPTLTLKSHWNKTISLTVTFKGSP